MKNEWVVLHSISRYERAFEAKTTVSTDIEVLKNMSCLRNHQILA